MNEQTRTVLILDDDNAVRESFMCHFEDRGWRVLSAETTEEALTAISKDPPCGAVVDIRLPGVDGTVFIRQISRTHPEIACVICTGSPEYIPPADIAMLPQVSDKIFPKPVIDMDSLEKELCLHIEKCEGLKHNR